MYRCIIFDMDGTLVNSYEGIYHAYEWTMKKAGLPFGGHSFVQKAIGAPLPYVFEQLCGMDCESSRQCIQYYREYYAQKGKYQAKAYDGMEETLIKLRQEGFFLGTATLKKESFAKEILKELGLLSYFDLVCGMDEDDRLTKADLIRRCIRYAQVKKSETVLVGDSEFDLDGARETGIAFLAVTYGFGFQDENVLKEQKIAMIADTAQEIALQLCGSVRGNR